MKRMILLAIVALLAGTTAHAATTYDLYLLAGQSNMDGRGKAKDLTEAQRQPMADAIIYYRNPPASTDGWKPLGPGYSIAPGYKGKLPSATFGPELGFAAAMLKARPGRPLALIKGSKGGTSLAKDWKPGAKGQPETQGPCYRNFIETVKRAQDALKARGDAFVIRGLLWHQGESDASAPAGVYEKELTTLIARLREDLGTPELPVVVGEVYDNGKRDRVREAQKKVAGAVPHVAFASAADLKTWDNGTHFDAPSQLTLGERFGAAMLTLLKK